MGKKKQAEPQGAPQFRVVVTRPNGRGPLAPYRLAIAVGFALLVAGNRIWTSLTEGVADDGALIGAAVAALFAWVITTVISKILGTGEMRQQLPMQHRQGRDGSSSDSPMQPPSLQNA